MDGIDPYAYLQQVAVQLKDCTDPARCHRLLDDIEYLYEVMDPELQDLAEQTMTAVRARLAELNVKGF